MAKKPKPNLSVKSIRNVIVAGISVADWDRDWIEVPEGFKEVQTELGHKVGLYRAVMNGSVYALGRAIEVDNGGLRKRLGDFRRDGSSGRDHWMGIYIHEHQGELEAQVLITGADHKAVGVAKALKPLMLKLHRPPKNVPEEIIKAKIAAQIRKKVTGT